MLLTPQRLAIKPTEIYSGVHCPDMFCKLTSPSGVIPFTEIFLKQLELSAYMVLAVFGMFAVYESTVTEKSHGDGKSTQINHKRLLNMCVFNEEVMTKKGKL